RKARKVRQYSRIRKIKLWRAGQTFRHIPRKSRKEFDQKNAFEQRHITLQRRLRNSRSPRYIGKIQKPAATRRKQGQQTRKIGRTFNIGKIANITLKDRGDVRTKPPVPRRSRLPADRLRETAGKHPFEQFASVLVRNISGQFEFVVE